MAWATRDHRALSGKPDGSTAGCVGRMTLRETGVALETSAAERVSGCESGDESRSKRNFKNINRR